MNVFHWLAVNPENPSPVVILFGMRFKSAGICMIFVRFSIFSRSYFVILLPSIHNLLIIQGAILRNKQCIRSTIRCLIGLKYGNRSSSVHLTRVELTWRFLSASDLHSLQSSAFCQYFSKSFSINQSSISSKPPKFNLFSFKFALL